MITSTFNTAPENMKEDERLFQSLSKGNSYIFRLYRWKTTGITYPKGRPLDKALMSFDHSERLTGGGIVFHAPGDILFSLGFFHSHKGPLKPLLTQVVNDIADIFLKAGLHPTFQPQKNPTFSPTYCTTYHSPFELYVHDEKVLGLAIRRVKDKLFIQGVIHISPNRPYFKELPPAFDPYFTQGMGDADKAALLYEALGDRFKLQVR
jgi:lipoate-protein ligase A